MAFKVIEYECQISADVSGYVLLCYVPEHVCYDETATEYRAVERVLTTGLR
jgi:hypothetical protein